MSDTTEPSSQNTGMPTLMALSPLSSLLTASIPGLSVLAPLVFWLATKDKDSSMDKLGKEILNSQISWLIWSLILIFITYITLGIGLILYIPFMLCWVIFSIIAAINVSKKQSYSMPLTISFL